MIRYHSGVTLPAAVKIRAVAASGLCKSSGRRLTGGMTVFKPRFISAVLAFALAASASIPAALAQTAEPGPPMPATSALLPPPGFEPQRVPADRIWPWEGTDLRPDPAIRFGRLDNGMRYAIRANATPKEAVVLRFRLDAGSALEGADEQGLAHFLEHMAFNGSTNIKEGELAPMMARLGSSFGRDVNAHVSVDETMYKLDLPRASEGRLEAALGIFRETADRLSIEEQAVRRETGVVLSEMQAGEGPARDLARAQNRWLLPEDRDTLRPPIGERAVVEQASAAAIRRFYETWYRPERAVLVVTGDVDPDATEAAIKAAFGSWAAKSSAAPVEPDNGRWPASSLRALVQSHPDLPPTLRIAVVRADETDYGEVDTAARRRWWAMAGLGTAVMRRRLATLQLTDDPPFSSVSYGLGGNDNGWSAGFGITPRGDDWRRALGAVAVELRQALSNGFNAAEIEEAVKEARLGNDRAISEAPTRTSLALAGQVMTALASNAVPTTPDDEKVLFEAVAAQATPEAVNSAFRWWWDGLQPALMLRIREAGTVSEAELAAAWQTVMAAPLPARAPYVRARFAPDRPGPPGTVTSQSRRQAQDVTFARFANGVTLAFKRTAFSRDRVSVMVSRGAGALALQPDEPLWPTYANMAWSADGVGALSRDQMITALAGRSTRLANGGVGDDRTDLSASVAPADLAEQLDVMLTQTRAPRLGPLGPSLLRDQMQRSWNAARLSASGWFSFNSAGFFMSGARRFETPTLERALAVDDQAARASLRAILSSAPITVAVVGDTTFEAARDAVAATFGAAPPPAGLDPGYAAIAAWKAQPTGGPPRVLTHTGPQTQAIAHVSWLTPGARRIRLSRELWALGQVFQLRLTEKVREAGGQSYSPSAGMVELTSLKDLGRIYAHAQVLPADVAAVEAAMAAIASELAASGPTPDELTRAIGPALEARVRARQTNGHWLARLAEAGLPRPPGYRHHDLLETDLTFEEHMRAVTPARLRCLAKRYLVPGNAIRIHVLPEPASAALPVG